MQNETQQKTENVTVQRATFEELMNMVTDQAEQIRELRNRVRELEFRLSPEGWQGP